MSKILIIVYDFPPRLGGGGVLRTVKLAKYLKKNGYDPIILTVKGKNQATSDNSLVNELSGVKIYNCKDYILDLIPQKLYKKNYDKMTLCNIKKESNLKKILKKLYNILLVDRGIGFLHSGYKCACSIIESQKVNIVYTTSPPHVPHIIGYKLKKKYKIKHIMDFRDAWHNNQLHDTNFIKRVFNYIYEGKTTRNADYIITTSNSVSNYFKEHKGIVNVQTVTNGYDEEDFRFYNTSTNLGKNNDNRLTISYIGSLGGKRTLKYFLEAVKQLDMLNKYIYINIIGNVDSRELMLINRYSNDVNISLIGNVSHKESIEWMINSNVLLILLPLSQDGMKAIPGKTFEYIRAQRPIIALCPQNSELSKLIIENKKGVVCEYDDISSIKELITNGYYSYINDTINFCPDDYALFSRDYQFSKLKEIFNKLNDME